jgi:hypothetical protein
MIADPRPGTRKFIDDQLNFALHHGDMARTCADIGDDDGLEHHVRRLVEYTKAVANATSDILRTNKAEAEQRSRAA